MHSLIFDIFWSVLFPFSISYFILRGCFDFEVPDYKICRKCGIAYEPDVLNIKVKLLSVTDMENNIYFRYRWFFRLFYFVGGISIISLIMGICGISDNIPWMIVLGFLLFIVTFASVCGAICFWKNKKLQ